jgi:hypothetical protein
MTNDRLKPQSTATLNTVAAISSGVGREAELICFQILSVFSSQVGRGCVKTISLFLSVGNRSTKSIFSQWFAP